MTEPESVTEAGTPAPSRGTKPALIWSVVILSGLGLIAAMQGWIDLTFAPGAATVEHLTVTGQKLNPALTLMSLAGVAAAFVLMIAGKVFRRVVGVIVAVLGAGMSVLAYNTLAAPLERADGMIREATGISGDAQAGLVTDAAVSVWPTVVLIVGALLAIVGITVTVVSGRWKTAGRKYDTGTDGKRRAETQQTAETDDRISDWEALSDGYDPTE